MEDIIKLVTDIIKFTGDTILGTVLYEKLSGIFIKDNDEASFKNYVEKPHDEALQEEFRRALTERLSASEEAISEIKSEIKKLLESSDDPRLVKIKKILIANKIITIDRNDGTINIIGAINIFNSSDPLSNLAKIKSLLITGSRRRYDELTGINGRFKHLEISDVILPDINPNRAGNNKPIDTEVKHDDQIIPIQKSLESLHGKECIHAVLQGEGGMGKTVSLIRFWDQYLKMLPEDKKISKEDHSDFVIPVFIPLNELNEYDQNNHDDFILDQIIEHYIRRSIGPNDQQLFNEILDSKTNNGKPQVILLLDGFNEITASKEKFLNKFRNKWMRKQGVQILITSRFDMRSTYNWNQFNLLSLQPLEDTAISEFLKSKGVKQPESHRLRNVISNPMFLTIYARTSQIIRDHSGIGEFSFKEDVTSQGEMLWNFFQAQLVKEYGSKGLADNWYWHKFLLLKFLPAIGYEFERSGKFYLAYKDVSLIVSEITDAILAQKESDYFGEFEEQEDKLRNRLNSCTAQSIIETLRDEFCILVKEQKEYRFLHQNFRDYLAAMHLINLIEAQRTHQAETEKRKFPKEWTDNTLSIYVRRYIGEITGEHNYAYGESNDTLLMKVINRSRGVFPKNKDGEILFGFLNWNIISVWKDCRKDLSGADLTNLDLRRIVFNSVRLYKKRPDGYVSARFDSSLLNERQFLPQGHASGINCVAYSINGKSFLSGSDDRTIMEWDVTTGELIKIFRYHSGQINSVCCSPDGKRIASGSDDSTIVEWDIATGEVIQIFKGHKGHVNCVSYSPDGMRIASGSNDGTVVEWNVVTGKGNAMSGSHKSSVTCISYGSDGKRIFSGSWDSTIIVWEVESRECIRTFNGNSGGIICISLCPNDNKIISGLSDSTIKEWDVETGECIQSLAGHEKIVTSVSYSPDGKKIVSGSDDSSIKEWSTSTGKCIQTILGHSSRVTSLCYSLDGKRFLSGSHDKNIREWDTTTGECTQRINGLSLYVTNVSYSPDGKKIVSGSDDTTIKEWDSSTGDCIQIILGHSSRVSSVRYSPDGKRFLSGSGDGTIREWDAVTGECSRIFNDGGRVSTICYSSSGKRILSGSWEGAIREWDAITGECIQTIPLQGINISSVCYIAGDRHFVSGSWDGIIRLWVSLTGKCIQTLNGQCGSVNDICKSPDRISIVSGYDDGSNSYGSIKQWNPYTGECIQTFDNQGWITSVDFNLDCKRVVSGSYDKTIKEWDVETGKCIQTFREHEFGVTSVRYSPDGKRIVSGSVDGTIREWNTETGKCIKVLSNVSGLLIAGCSFRNLHPDSKISEEAKELMKMYRGRF